MKIIPLLENVSSNSQLRSKHGLCLYIETIGKKILFDVGPNDDFIKNAAVLNVDLNEIDYVIISHGHFDHGKGLATFLEINQKAKVIISKHGFLEHRYILMGVKVNIGLNKPMSLDRFIFIEQDIELDGMFIRANVAFQETPLSDQRLYVKKDRRYLHDDFQHEIYLVLKEENKNILITGCSHRGILSIIHTIESRMKLIFDYVIGGFHLMRFRQTNREHLTYLTFLRKKLSEKPTKYYTCHCTGKRSTNFLKETMHQLYDIHTGDTIEI